MNEEDLPGQILRPNSPLPPGFNESQDGLIRPGGAIIIPERVPPGNIVEEGLGLRDGLFRPVRKILTGDKEQDYRTLVVAGDSDTRKLAPKTPEVKTANPDAILFFLAQPWGYLDSRLQQVGLPSPIADIEKQIDDHRSSLPKIPETSKILLKSPLKHIRDAERTSLGMSQETLYEIFAPDTAVVNCAELPFVYDNEHKATISRYADFLAVCIDELLVDSTNLTEELKHISRLFKYLDVLTLTFLYKTNQTKIDRPQILDLVASKMEWLESLEQPINKKYLGNLFDFLSYFQMNSQAANQTFLRILNRHNFTHPILHELNYQLVEKGGNQEKEEVNKKAPKIGIEIEGVPSVIFGGIPEGFELGSDTSAKNMPEFRRKAGEYLFFNHEFKKQLFELWYWAKLTQMKGASVHIHIDNNEKDNAHQLFAALVGFEGNTCKRNLDYNTVELRFNLTSYPPGDIGGSLLTNAPFFHQQYDLIPLIEFLLQYSENQTIDRECYEKLPPFWQARFERKMGRLSFEEVMEIAERDRDDTGHLSYLPIEQIGGNLTYGNIVEIFKYTYPREKLPVLISVAAEKLGRHLTFTEFLDLSKQTPQDGEIILAWIKNLSDGQNLEDVLELFISHPGLVLSPNSERALLNKVSTKLSYQEYVSLAEETKWNFQFLNIGAIKLIESLTFDQAMDLVSLLADKISVKQWWAEYFINLFSKIDKEITIDDYYLIKNQFPIYEVLRGVIENLGEPTDLEMMLELSKDDSQGNRSIRNIDLLINAALGKFGRRLSLDEVINLQNEGFDVWSAPNLVARMHGSYHFDELIPFLEISSREPEVIGHLIEKLDSKLSISQIIRLLLLFYRRDSAYQKLFDAIDELSLDEIIKILTLGDDMINPGIISELAFPKLKRKISLSEFIRSFLSFLGSDRGRNDGYYESAFYFAQGAMPHLSLKNGDIVPLFDLFRKFLGIRRGLSYAFQLSFPYMWTTLLEASSETPLVRSMITY